MRQVGDDDLHYNPLTVKITGYTAQLVCITRNQNHVIAERRMMTGERLADT
jgi:pyruvate-formate lyase